MLCEKLKIVYQSIKYWFLISTFLITSLNAQNLSVENKIKPAFKDYFGMPRASVFLHLNKSAYVEGEHLWFKSYLYNRLKNNLLKEPLNLYIGIYDSVGQPIKKELFISRNGLALGQVLIDSTFDKGTYYIKASTSWMRNFQEDDSFISQFDVVQGPTKIKGIEDEELDVQFLPEGGYLVSDVQGTVGVKVINSHGNGVKGARGIIRNNRGDSITAFITNNFGHAKFEILPQQEILYSATMDNFQGKKQKILLPKSKPKGIAMSIRRISSDRIMILLGTNSVTRAEMGSKPFSLLFHRDGLLKHMEVVFPSDKNYVSYVLDSESLHPGTNIITLIDSYGNPLLERLVFNRNSIKQGELKTSLGYVDRDSVSMHIDLERKSKGFLYLSASVLPAETKAYRHDYNILSTFLLTPYLSGSVENPKYYFSNVSEKTEKDLDLLLLTQGWSRYEWKNIFENAPVERNGFETGVDVLGQLNFELRKNEGIMLYPGEGSLPQMIKIKEGSKSFFLENYDLEKGTELRFTVVDANGRLSRPNLYVRVDNGTKSDVLHKLPNKRQMSTFDYQVNDYSGNFSFVLPDNTITLNEVTVEGSQEDPVYVSPHFTPDKLVKVTEKTIGNFPRLLDLIRSSGFNVWEAPNTGYDRIRITSKRPLALSLTPPSPRLYVDDIPYSDFNILTDFSTSQLESYFIDRSGNGEPGAAGGVIRVYTKKGVDQDASGLGRKYSDKEFFIHIVKNGFGQVKEFYVPKYASVSDDSFKNFGTIHWLPSLEIVDGRNGTFVFQHLDIKRMKVFIEGIGEDGTLYSTMEEVQISPD